MNKYCIMQLRSIYDETVLMFFDDILYDTREEAFKAVLRSEKIEPYLVQVVDEQVRYTDKDGVHNTLYLKELTANV